MTDLATYGKVSSDRQTRIQQASSLHHVNSTPALSHETDESLVGLFDHVAFADDSETDYVVGRVLRMTRLYKIDRGRHRQIGYIRPINFRDEKVDLTLRLASYQSNFLELHFTKQKLYWWFQLETLSGKLI